MKSKKSVVVGVGLAAVSVMVLGACSSNTGSSQPQVEPSATQQTRSAAPAPVKKVTVSKDGIPKGHSTTMLKAPGDSFKGVTLTHNADAKCVQDPSIHGRVQFNCTNVTWNVMGDAVYVRLPNHNYNIEIENVSRGSTSMRSTQRDYAYSAIQTKGEPHDRIIRWKAPDKWSVDLGWGAGVESYYHFDGSVVSVEISIFLN